MSDYTFEDDERSYHDTLSCMDVGMNGGCGFECPVMRRGNCENILDFPLKPMVVDFYHMGCLDILYDYDEMDHITRGFDDILNPTKQEQDMFEFEHGFRMDGSEMVNISATVK